MTAAQKRCLSMAIMSLLGLLAICGALVFALIVMAFQHLMAGGSEDERSLPGAAYVAVAGVGDVVLLALLRWMAAWRWEDRAAVFAAMHGVYAAPAFAVDGWRAAKLVTYRVSPYDPSYRRATETQNAAFLWLLLGAWCVMFFVARWVASDEGRAWDRRMRIGATGGLCCATVVAPVAASLLARQSDFVYLTRGLVVVAAVGWVAALVALIAAWSAPRPLSWRMAGLKEAVHEGDVWVSCDGERVFTMSAARLPVGPVVLKGFRQAADKTYRAHDVWTAARVLAGSREDVARRASDMATSHAAYAVTCLLLTFAPIVAAVAAEGGWTGLRDALHVL